MTSDISQLILRFKAQPTFVRVFFYFLAAAFVIRVLGTFPDFFHGFSRGLADGLNRVN